MRSSITLFDDQYKLYKTGSKKLLIAFVEYMFEWIEPNLKPSEMNIFNSLRERMDNSIKAHDGRSKWWKNSHGWPSKNEPNLNEIWTENEQKMDEKWTENELNLNENAIWDINSDLQTINSWNNSWTTTIKRKKEDIIISKDIIVDESTEQKIDNGILYESYPYKDKWFDKQVCDKLIIKQLEQWATIKWMLKEMKLEQLELRIKQWDTHQYWKKLENWLKQYVEWMADSEDRLRDVLRHHRKRLENWPSYRKNPWNELCELFGKDYVNKLFMETKQGVRLFTT